ncbi:MAG: hypothetical protein WBQ85_04600 [Candidatus Sulfotelmatobacter sp.]
MTVARMLQNSFAVIGVTICMAAAQTSVPSAAFRQPLDDAWWTGPLLAPNASTLPQGHVLVEPYVYDVITEGFYNSAGTRVSAPHQNGYGSLTYINYGLVNKFTVGVIPTFGYNEPDNGAGGRGVGDLMVQAQYRLHLFHEGGRLPTTSVNVQETLPTGKYDQLDRPSDGFGAGAYTTTLGLYTQTFFWMPTGRILRARFNVTQALSHSVNIQDASVYGTSQGFRGHASSGAALLVDLAAEYNAARHWVLVMEGVYRHQYSTHVAGFNIASPNLLILLNSGSSQVFGLAPAVEYNFNSRVGVILGMRLFPAGKNATESITPVVAVNIVH